MEEYAARNRGRFCFLLTLSTHTHTWKWEFGVVKGVVFEFSSSDVTPSAWGRRYNHFNFSLLFLVSNFTFGSRICCWCCLISYAFLLVSFPLFWSWFMLSYFLCRHGVWSGSLIVDLYLLLLICGESKSVVMELFLVGVLCRMLGSGVDLASEFWIWAGEIDLCMNFKCYALFLFGFV